MRQHSQMTSLSTILTPIRTLEQRFGDQGGNKICSGKSIFTFSQFTTVALEKIWNQPRATKRYFFPRILSNQSPIAFRIAANIVSAISLEMGRMDCSSSPTAETR